VKEFKSQVDEISESIAHYNDGLITGLELFHRMCEIMKRVNEEKLKEDHTRLLEK